ncbi:fumarate hydratase class II [Nonlabens ulvanivorans]|uniref:Fumarate hydratase class II n=1 Tax=Nonlabens ulvanivorans TaxID=906888 RepID=A0A081DF68_NONUL|nr:fumarate hydratase class II [Nonlabens ulvanivorans]GAL75742.1 fumarate hydratase class II [Nonlabens ulvanivorans]
MIHYKNYTYYICEKYEIMAYRIEKDTMGPVEVPADKLWGRANTAF